MFEKALNLFDLPGMMLLADREYIGTKWFKFLKDNKIDLYMWMDNFEREVYSSKGRS
jgi:hypothetical protein